MALTETQQDQVDALKRLVGDVTVAELDDQDMYDILQDEGDSNAAAARVWGIKAAKAADLVDVREGTSTRPLSQLSANALRMQAYYAALAGDQGPSAGTGTRVRAIVRP